MKYIVIISLLLLSIFSNAQQIDQTRVIHDRGIGDIIIDKKLKKKQLRPYGQYTKEVRYHNKIGEKYFIKTYFCDKGLEVKLQKKRFGLCYKIISVSIKYYFDGITDKGIDIKSANKQDIIEKYGIPNETYGNMIYYYLESSNRIYFRFDDESYKKISEIIIY
jgi:hypothetical protein